MPGAEARDAEIGVYQDVLTAVECRDTTSLQPESYTSWTGSKVDRTITNPMRAKVAAALDKMFAELEAFKPVEPAGPDIHKRMRGTFKLDPVKEPKS